MRHVSNRCGDIYGDDFRKWSYFFFFQAEDGIRDTSVTGVQTCALPIFDDQAGVGSVALGYAGLLCHRVLWHCCK